jgi:GTP:adenosylcobinamide-phosphate guanylyltransferase
MENPSNEQLNLDVLVLAAGLGTRMRSNLAKVLHQLDGRPLINHVCRTATALAPRKIYVVIGHQGETVKTAVLEELNENFAELFGRPNSSVPDTPLTQRGNFWKRKIRPCSFCRATCR